MNILQVHNYYQQPGGEDQFSSAERQLLIRHGHSVDCYVAHNDTVKNKSSVDVALRSIWNGESYRNLRRKIQSFQPLIIHAHNTFPLVSPALYYAAAAERVPVVQTLHNYRLICPAATLHRNGRVCEDCLTKKVPYPGVVQSCYRNDRLASATVAIMLTTHRVAGTWTNKVQTYIALTDFARRKFLEGGLPQSKLVVKPIFLLDDPGPGTGSGKFALYIGRLSEEKGLRTLLRAWESVPDIPLTIVGDGPLRDFVKEASGRLPNVNWMGFVERTRLWELLKSASMLVVPSEWYEGLPATAVEAMACGTPVVASNLGSLSEIIIDGVNGVKFDAADPQKLARQVIDLMSNPDRIARLRLLTRMHHEETYTADRNYRLLSNIYEDTIRSSELEYAQA